MSRPWRSSRPHVARRNRVVPQADDSVRSRDPSRDGSRGTRRTHNHRSTSEMDPRTPDQFHYSNQPAQFDDQLGDVYEDAYPVHDAIEEDPEYQQILTGLSRHTAPHMTERHISSYQNTTSLGSFSSADFQVAQPTASLAAQPRYRPVQDISQPRHHLSQRQVPPSFPAPSASDPSPSSWSLASSTLTPTNSSPSAELTPHTQPHRATFPSTTAIHPDPAVSNCLPTPSTTREEVSSQPQASAPVIHGIHLVNLRRALPDKFRALFPFEFLNAVQSKCFEAVYKTNDNVVVSAPTGSGKTAILELAICKLALDRGHENFKIVYQAPTKALCAEKARDWEKKLAHMNLKCAELTGDTSQAEMRRVGDASIIVTTPEKWDSITRKWQDHRRLLQLVELFLIDEVHILKDVRGATLEAVVSRMKTIGTNVRFIALSATVPNSDDIAQWLGRNHTSQHLPALRETFGEEFRPVKLQKFVYGYECNGNEFILDKLLDSKLPGLIARHSQQKPILVFCFTRKSCESTASLLVEYAASKPNEKMWPVPKGRIPVISRELQEIVKFGVAFHHAGLDSQDRGAVEQSFLKGELGVICCTSTLAVGINLPCHTVVLKGTMGYTDDKLQEYSDLEVMQMLGRAGRPQFDDSATAIILTKAGNKARYEKMVSGQEILESTLHLNLIEHLNSEVGLGTIHDLGSAKKWLGGTFLSVRLRRNPNYYHLTGHNCNPSQIDAKLEEICERDIRQLQEAQCVTDNETFKSTYYGRAMSKYMVEFRTMKMLLQIPKAAKMEALITILSQASEFKEFRFKPAERSLFREMNQSPLIVYPIKEAVTQTSHKISLMVQAHLGSVQYPDSADAAKARRQLMLERRIVFERLNRLVHAVVDCKGNDHDAVGMKNALELARSLAAESWEGRVTQLTQVPSIGPVGMRKLASKGIRTVLELADMDSVEIERLMARQTPFGMTIKSSLDKFPRLSFDLVLAGHKTQPRSTDATVEVEIRANLRYLNRLGPPYWKKKTPNINFLAETTSGALSFFWRESMRKLEVHKESGYELKFSVGLQNANDDIVCHFTCEEIVGTMVSKTLKHNIPASAFPKRAALATAPPSWTQSAADKSIHRSSNVGQMDELDDGGIDDSDFILAAEQAFARSAVNPPPPVPMPSMQGPPPMKKGGDGGRAEYPGIEELVEMAQEEESSQTSQHEPDTRDPVQLPNGKWQCNHNCAGGTLTKTGKLCTHRCCKEGLDKPRKRAPPKPRFKRTAGEAWVSSKSASQAPVNTKKPKLGPAPRSKVAPPVDWNAYGFTEEDLECIDLSSFSDDELDTTATPKTKQNTTSSRMAGAAKPLCPPAQPPSHALTDDDDDDDGDEDLPSLDELCTANTSVARKPPITYWPLNHGPFTEKKAFRPGAADVVFFEGIAGKFDKRTGDKGLSPDERDISYPGSSPMFVDQESPRRTKTSSAETALATPAKPLKEEKTPWPDNLPDWLKEMDPNRKIVDFFGPCVTYV
ncbi:putative ATP-dependent DNA helicase [Triangularia verruculosa]|uniref:DNA 3'-5' helicase n=1 Tax=Triangularia verruculosa TaxID=2587418 RepID=A0AAN6XI23_9PEZI|nr:putative ATP-dependent DNA helicase [Triangularia verruculosa]